MKKTLTNLALAALTLVGFSGSLLAAYKPAPPPHKPAPAHKPAHAHKAAPAHKHAHKPVTPAHKPTYKPGHKPVTTHKPAPGYKPGYKPTYKPAYKPGYAAYKPVTVSKAVASRYAYTRGVKFSKGYYYKGRAHYHWSKRYWSPKWRSWFFYDPSVSGWYYWSGARACYYPASYITTVAPSGYVLPAPGQEAAEPESPEVGECQASLGNIPAVPQSEEPDLPVPQE
jgi:hypothetical protein